MAAAIEANIRGGSLDPVFGVVMPGDMNLAESGFKYEGFQRTGHRLLSYSPRAEGAKGMTIAGILDFKDGAGRKASVAYKADYFIEGEKLTVEEAHAVPVFSRKPEVKLFLVPAAFMAHLSKAEEPDWQNLYATAVVNDVLADKEDDFLRRKNEYTVLMFLMDRVAPSSLATLKIAKEKSESTRYGWEDSSEYLDFKGWKALSMSGTFYATSENPFYLKVAFAPGREADDNRLALIFNQDLREMRKGLLTAKR
ncbi:MAG: hypothetical protein ACYTGH_05050 [Planctomycetota bacterium]